MPAPAPTKTPDGEGDGEGDDGSGDCGGVVDSLDCTGCARVVVGALGEVVGEAADSSVTAGDGEPDDDGEREAAGMPTALCVGDGDGDALPVGVGITAADADPLGETLGEAPLDSVGVGVPVEDGVDVPVFELVGVGDAVIEGVALGD